MTSNERHTEKKQSAHRLSRELWLIHESLNGEDTTLGELQDKIGERGFGLLLMVLSLPAALPLPAPGYATPFGIIMVTLGAQMMLGRTTPWLPNRLRAQRISYRLLDFTIRNGGRVLQLVEWLIRPRLGGLARKRRSPGRRPVASHEKSAHVRAHVGCRGAESS